MFKAAECSTEDKALSGLLGIRVTTTKRMSPIPGRVISCIASVELGYEHVSVVVHQGGKTRTPVWAEMAAAKDLFWDEEDTVVQLHPPKSEYVNIHKSCLHLWRKQDGSMEEYFRDAKP